MHLKNWLVTISKNRIKGWKICVHESQLRKNTQQKFGMLRCRKFQNSNNIEEKGTNFAFTSLGWGKWVRKRQKLARHDVKIFNIWIESNKRVQNWRPRVSFGEYEYEYAKNCHVTITKISIPRIKEYKICVHEFRLRKMSTKTLKIDTLR